MEVKVMTYNVHSCRGRDHKVSTSRIAEIIAASGAEIVALQELDAGLPRSGFVDQAQAIADQLKMHCHFSPCWWLEEGRYGNALLSRYPLSLKKAEGLPTLDSPETLEPRGVIWAETAAGDRRIQVFNTHLGLRKKERRLQIDRLTGPEWLGHPDCRPPIIFCGDLNALPNSYVVRSVRGILMDVQLRANGRPRNTYPSRLPLVRIDYVFASKDIGVRSAAVPRSDFARTASDHLPLVVEIIVPD